MDWNISKLQIFYPRLKVNRQFRIGFSIVITIVFCRERYFAGIYDIPSFGEIVLITFFALLIAYILSFPLVLFHHKYDSESCSDISGVFGVYSWLFLFVSFIALIVYIHLRYQGEKISIWVGLTVFLIAFALQIISRIFGYFSMTLKK